MKLIKYKDSERRKKLIIELRKKIIRKIFDYAQYVRGIDNLLYNDLVRLIRKYIQKHEENIKRGEDSIFD